RVFAVCIAADASFGTEPPIIAVGDGVQAAAPTAADYEVAVLREEYAALLISLARQERPDTSAYDAPEVVWRLVQDHHAGLIVRSESYARIAELREEYERRFTEDFYAFEPPKDKPSH
ncbi:MAG: hypothetical protein ABI806_13290, partial [Candidatus Solibacter sp.]